MPFGFTPAEVRAEYLTTASVHRAAGRTDRADRMEAEAAFRDRFPVDLGWAPDTTVDLAAGTLFVPIAVLKSLPSQLVEAGATFVAEVAVIEGGSRIVIGATVRPSAAALAPTGPTTLPGVPAPLAVPGTIPRWLWWVAGAGVLVLVLAVGRRKAA